MALRRRPFKLVPLGLKSLKSFSFSFSRTSNSARRVDRARSRLLQEFLGSVLLFLPFAIQINLVWAKRLRDGIIEANCARDHNVESRSIFIKNFYSPKIVTRNPFPKIVIRHFLQRNDAFHAFLLSCLRYGNVYIGYFPKGVIRHFKHRA